MFEDEINRAYRQEVLWEEMIQTEGSRGVGVTRESPSMAASFRSGCM